MAVVASETICSVTVIIQLKTNSWGGEAQKRAHPTEGARGLSHVLIFACFQMKHLVVVLILSITAKKCSRNQCDPHVSPMGFPGGGGVKAVWTHTHHVHVCVDVSSDEYFISTVNVIILKWQWTPPRVSVLLR